MRVLKSLPEPPKRVRAAPPTLPPLPPNLPVPVAPCRARRPPPGRAPRWSSTALVRGTQREAGREGFRPPAGGRGAAVQPARRRAPCLPMWRPPRRLHQPLPRLPLPADRAKWLGPFSEGAVPSYLKGERGGSAPGRRLLRRGRTSRPTVLPPHLHPPSPTPTASHHASPPCPLPRRVPRRLRLGHGGAVGRPRDVCALPRNRGHPRPLGEGESSAKKDLLQRRCVAWKGTAAPAGGTIFRGGRRLPAAVHGGMPQALRSVAPSTLHPLGRCRPCRVPFAGAAGRAGHPDARVPAARGGCCRWRRAMHVVLSKRCTG